jgi:hypothetical protein
MYLLDVILLLDLRRSLDLCDLPLGQLYLEQYMINGLLNVSRLKKLKIGASLKIEKDASQTIIQSWRLPFKIELCYSLTLLVVDPYLLQLEAMPGIPFLRTFNLLTSWQPSHTLKRKTENLPKHDLEDSKKFLPHFFVFKLRRNQHLDLRNAEGVFDGKTPISDWRHCLERCSVSLITLTDATSQSLSRKSSG